MFFYLVFLNIYYWKNLTFSKLVAKVNFSERRNALVLKSKKVQGIFGKRLFVHYYLQLSFVYKTVSQISFKLFFFPEIKGFYLSSLGYEVDFRDIWTFPLISWLKIKLSKTEKCFCRWKSTDNNEINIFLSLENPCAFLFAKEKTWKRITLIVNYRTKSYRKTNCAIQNSNELAIEWYMMLYSLGLFWLKNRHFSTNSCKVFIVSLI